MLDQNEAGIGPHLSGGCIWIDNGAQGRNRTTDTAIFSRMLYQLSYLGPQLGTDVPAKRGRP